MHDTAHELGSLFFDFYWQEKFRKIIDIGSMNINGTLRDVCPTMASYVGIDMMAGPGVDVVVSDPYKFPFEDESFDIAVATSCFEHDPMFWVTFNEIMRLVKSGGYAYINTPSNGFYHGHPIDCWRFYPDASLGLESWARRNLLEVTLVESFIALRKTDQWNDCVMVFHKGDLSEPPARFLVDSVQGAENIHKFGHAGLLNPDPLTEDQRIMIARKKALSEQPMASPLACLTGD
jgi:SAM-dependent methyltransferase